MNTQEITEQALKCLDSAQGWDVESMSLNILSNLPGSDPCQVERICEKLLEQEYADYWQDCHNADAEQEAGERRYYESVMGSA